MDMQSIRAGLLLVLALAIGFQTVGAAPERPLAPDNAPAALEAWRDWVLDGEEQVRCPLVADQRDRYACRWPGQLSMTVDERQARFSQHWQLLTENWVSLPGSHLYWPQDVTVNGETRPVVRRNGQPSLLLPPGDYDVAGTIRWQERPQTLTVPTDSGLIALSVDGKEISPLRREGPNLTLGRSTETVAPEADSLEFQVYRRLVDDIPAGLTTQIQFQVSGKAREATLPTILPEGFVPTAIRSPWPARLDADGSLQIQVQPGQQAIYIEARAEAPLTAVRARLSAPLEQEVWSYQAVPSLRTTAISPGQAQRSALAIDPRQAGVPQGWQKLPAFAMSEGTTLQIEERSRGLNTAENQRLTLQREMWLDFSGKGFFARDRIDGRMQHGWRFDVVQPYTLERADDVRAQIGASSWGNRQLPSNTAGGVQSEGLLVTYGAQRDLTGVEWRRQDVTLNAGVRLTSGAFARMPVTGWQQTFDQVSTQLHLPYGYRLIAAPGTDVASNTWISHWTILDIFFAAFFALLAWKLLGIPGGLIAAGYLFLALPEPGAPSWTLAALMALALLRKALPDGKLKKLFRFGEYCALLCFAIAIVNFMPDQIRAALYPQLEDSGYGYFGGQFDDYAPAAAARTQAREPRQETAKSVPPLPASPKISSISGAMEKDDAARNKMQNQLRQRYAQSTVMQTGGGEPDWQVGETYSLRWSGPVTVEQTVKLIVSPPLLTRLLRVTMLLLLGVLLWKLIRTIFPPASKQEDDTTAETPPQTPPAAQPAGTVAVAVLTMLAAALFAPPPATAQETETVRPAEAFFPPDSLLQTLKQRLLQAPPCAPDCAAIANALVEVGDGRVRVRMEAHALDHVALAIPRPQSGEATLTLREVRLDGKVENAVLQYDDKHYIALPRGVHFVELEFLLDGDQAALYFHQPPMRVDFAGEDWRVEGLRENRLLSEVLRFVRAEQQTPAPDDEGDAAAPVRRSADPFPPYVQVTRELVLDLDWSVYTTVTRIAPREGGLTANIPLLAGEYVTTPDIQAADGQASVSFGYGQNAVSWESRLDKRTAIELEAPPLADRAEVWRVLVSPSWHLDWSGVPINLPAGGEDQFFEFHPLPGERLKLELTQPVTVQGMVRAIDRVDVAGQIGPRASKYTLRFALRASQGGEHVVTLPAGFEMLSVSRNGENLNLQARDNALTLPVSPGAQTFAIELRDREKTGTVLRSPVFDLGLPAANIGITLHLPEQRWLLAAFGPPVGPAVLYWGELLAALIIAFLFSRTRWSTLRFHHWLLLVLGFSTFSWMALLMLAFWLCAMHWRGRADNLADWKPFKFDMMQIGLAILSVVMLGWLISAVSMGLLSTPDMGVKGYGSYGGNLIWFADQSGNLLPTVTAVSLPIWVYRFAMLAWALWLAFSLIGWLRGGLLGWMRGGYWKKLSWGKKNEQPAKTPTP